MYCVCCGEEPNMFLEECCDCGQVLCERCWGDPAFECCRECLKKSRLVK